ncbi:MAG TPA: alpha-L-rhamnosidase C-terminal domain-containing protein, partial [Acidobacteriaceae bacterium]|nr:alpha-L-rhamnosidase C-terminal domain-containing protein [Acidobacteriaceae bacterium]
HPNFDSRMGNLDFRYQSTYGEIRSSWSIKGTGVWWTVTVPPNTTAHLQLNATQRGKFTLDGETLSRSKKLHPLSGADETRGYELTAGTYSFQMTTP